MRFKSLDGGDAAARVEEIIKAEGVLCEAGVVERLLKVSEGDLRRCITYLQSAHRLTSAMSSASPNGHKKSSKSKIVDDDSDEDMQDADVAPAVGSKVTVQIVDEIAGVVPPATINELVDAMQPNTRIPIYNGVAAVVRDKIVADGWSANQVLQQLYQKLIMEDETISAPKKNKIVSVFSAMDKQLIDGADEHLTILDFALQIGGILWGSK